MTDKVAKALETPATGDPSATGHKLHERGTAQPACAPRPPSSAHAMLAPPATQAATIAARSAAGALYSGSSTLQHGITERVQTPNTSDTR